MHLVDADGAVIGRGDDVDLRIDDSEASRHHARVRLHGGLWFVEDLGSRNGTYVDGVRVHGSWRGVPRTIRVGRSLWVVVADVGPEPSADMVEPDGTIAGPTLRDAWRRVEEAARTGLHVLLRGESGSGKEVAARRFHHAGPRAEGPFVAVNCATVPAELAERILFGARRGAFSGAVADATGLVESAAGGTLFLDEIAELPLAVQAKLLRTLDDGEVTPLGATRPRRIELGLVSATHVHLPSAVAERRFREDLFYRIAGYTIELPPLRDRPEEIVAHVERALAEIADAPDASVELLEACVLRRWHGNVRELRACVRRAVTEARVRGATRLRATDLPPAEAAPAPTGHADPLADDEAVAAALRRHGGNVSACARELGLHRTQLRRWIARTGFEPAGRPDGPDA